MASAQPWTRPARPRRPLRTGLLVGAVVLLLCCVGAAGLGAWNVQAVRRATGPVRESVDGFLREVSAGDTAAAYGRLCADTRSRWSQLGFTQWLRTPPRIDGHEILKVSVATERGRPRGSVRVRLTRAGAPVEERDVPVVAEGDRWRVCGDPY
jgi:hypothetical protein